MKLEKEKYGEGHIKTAKTLGYMGIKIFEFF